MKHNLIVNTKFFKTSIYKWQVYYPFLEGLELNNVDMDELIMDIYFYKTHFKVYVDKMLKCYII